MSRSHITTFIVDGSDYFAAHLDNGRACVGMVGGYRFDFPCDHAGYSDALTAKTEADAEAIFDKYAAKYL